MRPLGDEMIRQPRIPMLPSELPQQRIYQVVELPPCPSHFDFMVGYREFPEGVVPKNGLPRSPVLLVQVEWAETPANNGIEAYYIQARKKYWVLWLRSLDDNVLPWRWCWVAIGYCSRREVDRKAAACHLLLEFWKQAHGQGGEVSGRDPYDWINEVGLLSVADVEAIVREIKAVQS